ncbi:MAG: MBL fold metallo-hydrolase, partial [Candidatus Omnitrophica bacterium]|nr:MBL fold metallo-hydrolase [Candidatus Omnitrophota bacterium]
QNHLWQMVNIILKQPLSAALLKTPPSLKNFKKRREILKTLDEFLKIPNSEKDEDVIGYYRKMIDHALDRIEREEVKIGLTIWKLYSSGFIIKTPKTTFALDLCEGPNKDIYGKENVPFSFTLQQREKIAKLVDYSFHTHHHYDHISYQMVKELWGQKKKIIVTQQNKDCWKKEPFAEDLTVPNDKALFKRGDLKARVYHGWQHMNPETDDETRFYHFLSEPFEVQCNAYLITTDNNISILVKGDIFDGDEFSLYLKELKKSGAKIDLYLSSTCTARGKDIIKETERLFDPFFIPAHEWEFTHRKPDEEGAATQSYSELCSMFGKSALRGKATVLSWGERLHYNPKI